MAALAVGATGPPAAQHVVVVRGQGQGRVTTLRREGAARNVATPLRRERSAIQIFVLVRYSISLSVKPG